MWCDSGRAQGSETIRRDHLHYGSRDPGLHRAEVELTWSQASDNRVSGLQWVFLALLGPSLAPKQSAFREGKGKGHSRQGS